MDAETGRVLREHLAAWPTDASGLVFRGRKGRGVARGTAQHAWGLATRGMVLRPRSGWHDLRHFHASLLIAGGLSVIAVADRLGHEDPAETLRTYGHLWPSDETRSVEAVHSALWGS